MADDLVERLRLAVNELYGTPPCGLMNEAADEIERLRIKLKEIFDLHHNNAYDVFLRDDATYEIACEALVTTGN